MKIIVEKGTGKATAEEAFWLAWKACGGPTGLGFLQDRSSATKEDVLDNVKDQGDYPMSFRYPSEKELYGDYVFGRMMKLEISFEEDSISFRDDPPRPDYQGWSTVYPSYQELTEAAITSLKEA